jgi:hypothetical protein
MRREEIRIKRKGLKKVGRDGVRLKIEERT